MRRNILTIVLAICVTMMSFPFGPTSFAAMPVPVSLVSLTFPDQVTAGETVTFKAVVSFLADVGLCCGYIDLKGPGGQTRSVRLVRKGGNTLEGSLQLSPHTPAGTWAISSLRLQDNTLPPFPIEPAKFKSGFTVVSSGKPADTKAPELVSLTAPDEVATGDAVAVTANVTDDLSGVYQIIATVRPVAEQPGTWSHTLELFPTEKPGEYAGTMLMDATFLPVGEQRVTRLVLKDQAGNTTTLVQKDLDANAKNKLTTKGKNRKVPEGLITSPYLNVIHPGRQGYWNWYLLDFVHAVGHMANSFKEPTKVREQIAGELPQLRLAADALRKEIYTDPTTKLRVVPLATTGKWMVLDAAIAARLKILIDLERREGKTDEDLKPLTPAALADQYSMRGESKAFLPLEATVNEFMSQIPAAYLEVLGQSPTAVKVLQAPAHESANYGSSGAFDRDLIFFKPVAASQGPYLNWGTSSIDVYLHSGDQLTRQMYNLFYEIGMHFGQAYFSAFDASDRSSKWSQYLSLRGESTWPAKIGSVGRPYNNLGDDFAWSFLPPSLGQQYFSLQSYPRLRENPDQAAAFKKLVEEKINTTPMRTTIRPATEFEVGYTDSYPLSIINGTTSDVTGAGFLFAKGGPLKRQLTGTTSGSTTTYTATDPEVGRISSYLLTAKTQDGGITDRTILYYRAPLMLDPVPAATNQSSLSVTGSAKAGATIKAGTVSATVNSSGRFTLTIPLTSGTNDIRLTASNSSLGAIIKVKYEPESTTVPFKVELPGTIREKTLTGNAVTAPFAMVTVNGLTAQADSKGNFPFRLPLDEGTNKVQFTAVSTSGNKATFASSVFVDTTAPELTVSVPLRTNQSVFTLTGKVDTGSRLLLNDESVKVANDGSFTIDIALTKGEAKELKFEAIDFPGNRTTLTRTIRLDNQVPGFTKEAKAVLSGTVSSGTKLTYEGKNVTVFADDTFSLPVEVAVGVNTYTLVTTYDGKPLGFLQFIIKRPYQINQPTAAEGDRSFTIAGRVSPGYSVTVGGSPIALDEKGNWSTIVQLSDDAPSVKVVIRGDGQEYVESVPLP